MNFFKKLKSFLSLFFLFVFLFLVLILPYFFIFAQNEELCESRTECKELLKKYEEKIAELEKEMQKAKEKKMTLKNELYLLNKKLKKLKLKIEQNQALIKELSLEIKDTEDSIEKTIFEIENSKENLAKILREIYKEDQKSPIEILLSRGRLSDYFTHLTDLQILSAENEKILNNIKEAKNLLEEQKRSLKEDKMALEKTLKFQILQKKLKEEAQEENNKLLKLSEAQYQRLKKEKKKAEKKAEEIRKRLFRLIGVKKIPTYQEALMVAKEIEELTQIRAPFLLAILTQESRLGKNVGQCYLRDFKTGKGVKIVNGKEIPWPRVMKPSWIPLFLETTKDLNLDPKNTPVSCWIPACANRWRVFWQKKYVEVSPEGEPICKCKNCYPYGWGGAMGPAQLMPFNWIGSDKYKERIEFITKKKANPWDFFDAALGAALHLKDCFEWGAKNEKEAAACYFGGPRNMKKSYHLSVYAEPVMAISKCHQDFIENEKMSEWCQRIIF